MNSFATTNLKEEADKLLSTLDSRELFPVPVIKIAESLGIKVLGKRDYDKEKSGHIELNSEGEATIIVNTHQSASRNRFTIAHEIAHYILDKDYLQQHGSIDRDGNARDETYRTREKRANEFAAHLLMPEDSFIAQWIANPSIKDVAFYFAVSQDAAQFRAINIGLEPWS
jgi:Zn-dependent peptidase ImmA (M78 family)